MSESTFKQESLDYHFHSRPGKLEIRATTPLTNQDDLAMAYSPGVAYACELIVEDPRNAEKVTSRGNLVAVISNGTAAYSSEPLLNGPWLADITLRSQESRPSNS